MNMAPYMIQKGEKNSKEKKRSGKILEVTMILNHELCDLHKRGWVFLFFFFFIFILPFTSFLH